MISQTCLTFVRSCFTQKTSKRVKVNDIYKLFFSDTFLKYCSIIKRLNCEQNGLFLTYETEFVLFLAVLENSVLPMG